MVGIKQDKARCVSLFRFFITGLLGMRFVMAKRIRTTSGPGSVTTGKLSLKILAQAVPLIRSTQGAEGDHAHQAQH